MRPYLSLATIDRYAADMARRGVSDVARSRRGFLTAYRRAGGDTDRLSEYWQVRRDGFIARHMAQVRERGEPIFEDSGEPTRRHLALIAWAYSPAPDRLPRHNPASAERTHPELWAGLARGEQYTPQPERIAERVHSLRRNAGARAIARELVNHCGWVKADARAITGKKWRKSMASPRAALSPDAQRVLLRALDAEVDTDVALVLRLCLVLGLRIAEATTVDRSRVTAAGLRVFGKGSKWRTVPWSVDRGARALAARLPAVATVTPGRAQRACTRLAAAHPELSALTPHVLRHTFATNALRCCMDPKALQAALGHDKFNTTLTYLHTLGDV